MLSRWTNSMLRICLEWQRTRAFHIHQHLASSYCCRRSSHKRWLPCSCCFYYRSRELPHRKHQAVVTGLLQDPRCPDSEESNEVTHVGCSLCHCLYLYLHPKMSGPNHSPIIITCKTHFKRPSDSAAEPPVLDLLFKMCILHTYGVKDLNGMAMMHLSSLQARCCRLCGIARRWEWPMANGSG